MKINKNDQVQIVRRLIEKNYGLGRAFRYIRNLKNYQIISDICLFRLVVMEIKNSNRNISIKTINYHFNKNIPMEDYEGNRKVEVLHDLYYSKA